MINFKMEAQITHSGGMMMNPYLYQQLQTQNQQHQFQLQMYHQQLLAQASGLQEVKFYSLRKWLHFEK